MPPIFFFGTPHKAYFIENILKNNKPYEGMRRNYQPDISTNDNYKLF